MDKHDESREPENTSRELETDPRFPSGAWTGFFLQEIIPPGRHWMEMELTFQDGRFWGEGRDRVGPFLFQGRYHLDDGHCIFVKTYPGRHEVFYDGYNEGKGIWGGWRTLPDFHGGFHIWPVTMGDPSRSRLHEALDAPAEVKELVFVQLDYGIAQVRRLDPRS